MRRTRWPSPSAICIRRALWKGRGSRRGDDFGPRVSSGRCDSSSCRGDELAGGAVGMAALVVAAMPASAVSQQAASSAQHPPRGYVYGRLSSVESSALLDRCGCDRACALRVHWEGGGGLGGAVVPDGISSVGSESRADLRLGETGAVFFGNNRLGQSQAGFYRNENSELSGWASVPPRAIQLFERSNRCGN